LRSLGYRMEKRPKPAAPTVVPVETAAQSGLSVEAISAQTPLTGEDGARPHGFGGETEPSVSPVEAETADVPPAAPVTVEAAVPNGMLPHASGPPDAAEELIGVAEAPTLASPVQPEPLASEIVGSPPSPDVAPQTERAAEEFIEVWRPGRRDEQTRSPRRERRPRQRRSQREPALAVASPAAAPIRENEAPPAAGQNAADRIQRRERHADRSERHPPRAKRARPPQGDRERPLRGDRGGRAARDDRGGRAPRDDRPDRDPALRAKYIKGRSGGGDRREPDPNSPFAKLAALKEQLEGGTKEPR
jgi:ATP-dependent RNA helicase SUPV3L1/SUV3